MEPKREPSEEEKEGLGGVGWGVRLGHGGVGLWGAQSGPEVEAPGGNVQGVSRVGVRVGRQSIEYQNHTGAL